MKTKILCSAAALALLSGCGLMEVGEKQTVSFASNVDETGIFDRDGKRVCATPCEIELPRQKNDLYFVAKKAGYVNRPFFLTVVPEKSFFKHMLTSGIIFPLSPGRSGDRRGVRIRPRKNLSEYDRKRIGRGFETTGNRTGNPPVLYGKLRNPAAGCARRPR